MKATDSRMQSEQAKGCTWLSEPAENSAPPLLLATARPETGLR